MVDNWEDLAAVCSHLRLRNPYLFGGAALDWSRGGGRHSDIDLQASGGAAAERDLLDAIAGREDMSLLSGPRDYWIFFNEPVRLFEVQFGDQLLDLNLMDVAVRPGHFSLETVRWRIEDRQLEDPHSALDWTPGEPVTLVTAIDSDNPLRMLVRLVRLANKHGLSLWDDHGLREVAIGLKTRSEKWDSNDEFHGLRARDSFVRHMAEIVSNPATASSLLLEIRELRLFEITAPAPWRLLDARVGPL